MAVPPRHMDTAVAMAAPAMPQPVPGMCTERPNRRKVWPSEMNSWLRMMLHRFIRPLTTMGVLVSPTARSTEANTIEKDRNSMGAQMMAK